MTARISAIPSDIQVTPGTETSVTLSIRNVGTVVDRYTIAIEGEAAAWTEAVPAQIPLLPGAEGTIELRFAAPRDARTTAGQQPIVVRAMSEKEPGAPAISQGVLDVASFSEISARLVPQNSRGRIKADLQLTVTNGGNAPVTPKVIASDGDAALDFEIEPATFTVPPGRSATASVRIDVRKVRFRGKVLPRSLQIEIATDDASLTLDGTFMHKPLISRWQFIALAALAIGLAVLMRSS